MHQHKHKHNHFEEEPMSMSRDCSGGRGLPACFRKGSALLALGLVWVAACSDDRTPTGPGDDVPSPSADRIATGQSGERGHEVAFHDISRQIKGFGGYFYDEEGNLVAWLVDPSEEARARSILEGVVKQRDLSAHERNTGRIVFRRAAWSFQDLSAWRDRATHPVLDISGVEWTDLDEAQNRLVVGISSAAVRGRVESVLRQQDVPLAAVLYEESSRASDELDLRDYKRGIEGGYQIQRQDGGTCTLGFNAYWGSTASFLTNSHCTAVVWGSTSTNMYQNDTSPASNQVGVELFDPTPWSCGLFGLIRCRWSDAAIILKRSSVSWSYGKIARTTFWGFGAGNSGSIVVDAKNPSMTIIGEYSFPTGGEMFDKMGRTTGWTYGFVKKTCVDMNKTSYAGPGLGRILCNDWTSYHSGSGDSGSPVFRWYGSTVRLAGLHWGSITSGGTRYGIISAMWNIEKDLGALSTF